jgi:hydroxypyruvate reductase
MARPPFPVPVMRPVHQLRADARAIFDAGVAAADPHKLITQTIGRAGDVLSVGGREYRLADYRNRYVVGAGKASARMAQALEQLLGPATIRQGVVTVKYGYALPTTTVTVVEAGHPIPDAAGVHATRSIIQLSGEAAEDDLIVCLLSGGASALLVCPADGLTLADKQITTDLLLKAGASIHETNTVRKHISKVKGGGLAKIAYPATVVTLILSDVVGDRVDVVASGPTAPDASTFGDALRVVERHRLRERLPPAVLNLLECGARGEVPESPKDGDAVFRKVRNLIVGNNRSALEAACRKARQLGYHAMLLSSSIEGETGAAAALHIAVAKEILSSNQPVPTPACIVSGGETTVVVQGEGRGGRNQEFALSAAIQIDGLEGLVVLSGGTDGTDGPTEAAGALIDGDSIRRGSEKGLDARRHLRSNDSYHFLKATGDLLVTGPTFTNVMDLRVMLIASVSRG